MGSGIDLVQQWLGASPFVQQLGIRVAKLEPDLAVLTLLRRADDGAVTGAVGPVVGSRPDHAPAPPAARLDLVRVHWARPQPGGPFARMTVPSALGTPASFALLTTELT